MNSGESGAKPARALSLPAYLTGFVGREQERKALGSLVLGGRLVTLVGSGGVGKTRLALQVAADLTVPILSR